jgi:tripartite motif-containing protein 71
MNSIQSGGRAAYHMKTTEIVLVLSVFFILPACGRVAPAAAPSSATAQITPAGDRGVKQVWSSTGNPNPFSFPDGLTVDPQGNLYVMDTLNNRVQEFDSSGHFITMWGSFGDGDGQFKCENHCQTAMNSLGELYVADNGNARVQKFDRSGKFLAKWGSQGSGDGQFLHPFGIGVDGQGKVYVGDRGNFNIQKFDGNGKFLAKWGSEGYKPGQFSDGFRHLAVDPQGNTYVADLNIGLEQFDNSGKFVGLVDNCGDDKPIESATGVTVDSQNHLYIMDMSSLRICEFDANRNFVKSWNGSDSPDGPLGLGGAIAVDSQENVYVTEPFINRIRKFQHQ